MTENIGHHGHDDQHDEQPYDYRIEDAEPKREIDEWIDAITRRPWFVNRTAPARGPASGSAPRMNSAGTERGGRPGGCPLRRFL